MEKYEFCKKPNNVEIYFEEIRGRFRLELLEYDSNQGVEIRHTLINQLDRNTLFKLRNTYGVGNLFRYITFGDKEITDFYLCFTDVAVHLTIRYLDGRTDIHQMSYDRDEYLLIINQLEAKI